MSPLAMVLNLFTSRVLNGLAIAFFLAVLGVVANALQQILFKKRKEPPLVFHWLPIIGSTVSYGMDPFDFFFKCQAKVRTSSILTFELDMAH